MILRNLFIWLLSLIICIFTAHTINMLPFLKYAVVGNEPLALADELIAYSITADREDSGVPVAAYHQRWLNGIFDNARWIDNSQEMSNAADVTSFGAKGDGISNDTHAIQKAIDYVFARGGGVVYIPDGTYIIDPDVSIKLKSNMSLILADNAILKASSSENEYYDIILILNATNVQVVGGKIVGDRYNHAGTTGEWGSGISILGSTNVRIADISICDCWGDGIYIGSSWEGTPNFKSYSDNIIIENFNIYNNRRQGICVISAKNLTIRNGEVSNSNGTRPEAGINLEPNNSKEFLQNILIENVLTRNNSRIGILVSLPTYNGSSNVLSITINNHNDIGSPYPISYYRYYESDICKITVHGTDPRNITSFY